MFQKNFKTWQINWPHSGLAGCMDRQIKGITQWKIGVSTDLYPCPHAADPPAFPSNLCVMPLPLSLSYQLNF